MKNSEKILKEIISQNRIKILEIEKKLEKNCKKIEINISRGSVEKIVYIKSYVSDFDCSLCYNGVALCRFSGKIKRMKDEKEFYEKISGVTSSIKMKNCQFGTPQFCKCKLHELAKNTFKSPLYEDYRKEVIIEKNILRLKKAGISERFAKKTFSTFEEYSKNATIIKNKCLEYSQNWKELKKNGEGLFLSGRTGIGKTHLISAIGESILKKGELVVFLSVSDLLQKIRKLF